MPNHVYTWGLSTLSGPKEDILVPRRVRCPELEAEVPTQVVAGGHFSMVLTESGSVWTWGNGGKGRLGHGDEEERGVPMRVAALRDVRVVQADAGAWHAAAVTDDGRLFAWGNNSRGECGVGHEDAVFAPVEVPLPGGARAVHVACGHQFTAVIAHDGTLFVCGSNANGKLGLGLAVGERVHTLTPVEALVGHHVQHVTCGFDLAAAVDTDGNVWTWGCNKECCLGVPAVASKERTVKCSNVPLLVEALAGRGAHRVSVSKGEFHPHVLVLTEAGEMFSFGSGYKHKLGHGSTKDIASPKLIDSMSGVRVTKVAAGGIHSSCLSDDGNVYTWGCGSNGRLGHPECEGHRYLYKEEAPRMVQALRGNAVDTACSYYHALAVVRA